jgi:hypothetical protein
LEKERHLVLGSCERPINHPEDNIIVLVKLFIVNLMSCNQKAYTFFFEVSIVYVGGIYSFEASGNTAVFFLEPLKALLHLRLNLNPSTFRYSVAIHAHVPPLTF